MGGSLENLKKQSFWDLGSVVSPDQIPDELLGPASLGGMYACAGLGCSRSALSLSDFVSEEPLPFLLSLA